MMHVLNCTPAPRPHTTRQQRPRSQSADLSCSYAYDGRCNRRRSNSTSSSSSCGFQLKGLFRRAKGDNSNKYQVSTTPPKETKTFSSVGFSGFTTGCLPSLTQLTVCGRLSPTESEQNPKIQEFEYEEAVPRQETAGEATAKQLYSKGDISEAELVHIMKGEEKYWSDSRPELRDPITLEPLGEDQFTFVRKNGTITPYNLKSLIEFFLVSGDFREPETRIAVTDEDLSKIDQQAKVAGLKLGSVFTAKHNPQSYRDKHQREEMLTGLDRLVGELVSTMVSSTIEAGSADDGQIRLLLDLFPQFGDFFGQLMNADAAYAQQCLTHYLLLVEGPPNRPIKDKTGMKGVVLKFLNKYRT